MLSRSATSPRGKGFFFFLGGVGGGINRKVKDNDAYNAKKAWGKSLWGWS